MSSITSSGDGRSALCVATGAGLAAAATIMSDVCALNDGNHNYFINITPEIDVAMKVK